MRSSFRQTCCRVAGMLFAGCALTLWLTPREAEWGPALSALGVLAGGTWIHCARRRGR